MSTVRMVENLTLNRLKRIQGQITGIARMIEQGRECPDILLQIRAAGSALRAFETKLLEGHLRGSVAGAIDEKKIEELMELIKRN